MVLSSELSLSKWWNTVDGIEFKGNDERVHQNILNVCYDQITRRQLMSSDVKEVSTRLKWDCQTFVCKDMQKASGPCRDTPCDPTIFGPFPNDLLPCFCEIHKKLVRVSQKKSKIRSKTVHKVFSCDIGIYYIFTFYTIRFDREHMLEEGNYKVLHSSYKTFRDFPLDTDSI